MLFACWGDSLFNLSVEYCPRVEWHNSASILMSPKPLAKATARDMAIAKHNGVPNGVSNAMGNGDTNGHAAQGSSHSSESGDDFRVLSPVSDSSMRLSANGHCNDSDRQHEPSLLSQPQLQSQRHPNHLHRHPYHHNPHLLPSSNSHSQHVMSPVSEPYTPQCILVTGGAGFIGSHLVDLLLKRYPQYRIVVLDKLDYCAALDNISCHFTRPNLKWCRGDIRSKCLVDYLLRSERIDTVMHFAASTHVDNSFHSSIAFTSNNVVGTHVLLEAAREYGEVRRFIHVSTDEVYGGETDGEKEDSMLAPTNPYACTKAAAELICRGYAKSFGMPIIITRGNNVYGPRQYPDKLIAKTCCLLARKSNAFIHGNGQHLRSYVYVTDMAEAFDIILHKGKAGAVYNVGSDEELTNLQVVRDCIRACELDDKNNPDAWISFVKDREVNDHHYSIDSTKLKQLGWRSRISWEDGIRLTTQWYSDEQNLERWPDFARGLVAHPSLEGTTKDEPLM